VVHQEARAAIFSNGCAARRKWAALGSIGARSADRAARFAFGARRGPDGFNRHRSILLHTVGRASRSRAAFLDITPFQPMIKLRSIFLFLFFAAAAFAAPASDIPVFGSANPKGGLTLSTPTQIVILLTLLTLLPAVVMSVSPFLRIVIVLHFLRQALGTQSAPSNQVLVGLSMFLAFLVMQPVVMDIYHRGWEPVENGQVTWEQGFDEGAKPLKNFLLKFAREKDIQTCVEMTKSAPPRNTADLDLKVLIPAYILSELKAGFQIGAVLYLPFLIIDLAVASITLSVGMVQLPPVMISAPFKILLFVLVDGWNLVIGSLLKTFY
jgi:flagellar biosynthetic protein FliP